MPKVYEELAFVLENKQVPRSQMDPLIEEALASVDLNVTDNTFVNHLSGGMKQKLAIVETILQEANTLFLDEPTAMLDVDATADLWHRLIQLWSDQTVLIVEHKVEYIWEHVDRVILMNYDGQIIADGTPDYVLKNCESLLTEFGVWHPQAWDHAPESSKFSHSTDDTLFAYKMVILFEEKTFVPSTRINCSFWRMDYYYRENGTGKTTLLESMMQLIKYEGVMSYKNTTLKKIKDAAQHMYLVYQNPELQFITNSVYEEIYIHYNHQEPSIAEKETMKLLKLLHLEAVKNQHPFELSMGQNDDLVWPLHLVHEQKSSYLMNLHLDWIAIILFN